MWSAQFNIVEHSVKTAQFKIVEHIVIHSVKHSVIHTVNECEWVCSFQQGHGGGGVTLLNPKYPTGILPGNTIS